MRTKTTLVVAVPLYTGEDRSIRSADVLTAVFTSKAAQAKYTQRLKDLEADTTKTDDPFTWQIFVLPQDDVAIDPDPVEPRTLYVAGAQAEGENPDVIGVTVRAVTVYGTLGPEPTTHHAAEEEIEDEPAFEDLTFRARGSSFAGQAEACRLAVTALVEAVEAGRRKYPPATPQPKVRKKAVRRYAAEDDDD
jgi:hypothetical protein